jgi:metal-responsive CopG/Arc/MetJ family transcriptional regulator
MSVRKVTISVDEDLLAEFERLAEEAGKSRSEAIAASLELSLKQMKLQRAVQLLVQESGGAMTAAEKAEARRLLGLPRR